jgi:integrase
MNVVQPIRDLMKIEEIKNELLKISYRDYMIFTFGINTGLRISDILKLKVSDVKNKDHIIIKEQKTGKTKRFKIQSQFKQEVEKYIQGMDSMNYLFRSRKGINKPIGRIQYYKVMRKAAEPLGIKEIGTHTLRKTFGYFHYKKNKDVALLQEIFNHSGPSVTLRYIGINQDKMDDSVEGMYL